MTEPLKTITTEDGYSDLLTGVGTDRDPTSNLRFTRGYALQEQELCDIFDNDGVGRRIVEGPAGEMIRPWFEVSGEYSKEIADRLEELGAKHTITEAATWARLHGGCVVVFAVNDGRDFDQPLGKVREVQGAQVFDRWRVSWVADSPSLDPMRRLKGYSQFLEVNATQGQRLRVHESRFVVVPGLLMTQGALEANGGWGNSVLNPAYDAIKKYVGSLGYSSNILRDFIQSVLAVKDLSGLLATGQSDKVERRLKMLDLSRSILNTMIIDADGETYTKSASSVAGIDAMIDRFVEHLSMVTGIPTNKLVGRASPGMNATGQVELINYYDMLASERDRMLAAVVERFVKLLYDERGGEPEAWSIVWNPFQQMSEKEIAELRKEVADADKVYIDARVLTPAEVAESRFGQDEWSMETQLDESQERATFESMAAEAMALAAAAEPEDEPDNRGEGNPDGD